MPDNDILLQEALFFFEHHNMTIIPIKHDKNTKKAAVKWKRFQSTKPPNSLLTYWFTQGCKRAVGLAALCGTASDNVVCRDFDTAQGYYDWAQQHATLAHSLPTVKTRSGYHVLFRTHPEYLIFQKYCEMDLYGKGEYRGTSKQYFLLPPSLHPSGIRYEWERPILEVIPLVEDPVEVRLLLYPERTKHPIRVSRNGPVCDPDPNIKPPPLPRLPVLGTGTLPVYRVLGESSGQESKIVRVLPEGATLTNRAWVMPNRISQAIKNNPVLSPRTRNSTAQPPFVRSLLRLDIAWDRCRLWLVFREWYNLYSHNILSPIAIAWKEFLHCFLTCPEPKKELDVEQLRKEADGLPAPAFLKPNEKKLYRGCLALQIDMERQGRGSWCFLRMQDAGRYLGLKKSGAQWVFKTLLEKKCIEQLSQGNNIQARANTYRVVVDPSQPVSKW